MGEGLPVLEELREGPKGARKVRKGTLRLLGGFGELCAACKIVTCGGSFSQVKESSARVLLTTIPKRLQQRSDRFACRCRFALSEDLIVRTICVAICLWKWSKRGFLDRSGFSDIISAIVRKREIMHTVGAIAPRCPEPSAACMRCILYLHERRHQQYCQTTQGQAECRPPVRKR